MYVLQSFKTTISIENDRAANQMSDFFTNYSTSRSLNPNEREKVRKGVVTVRLDHYVITENATANNSPSISVGEQ